MRNRRFNGPPGLKKHVLFLLYMFLLVVTAAALAGGRYSPLKSFMQMADVEMDMQEFVMTLPHVEAREGQVDWRNRVMLPQRIVVTNEDMTYALIFRIDSVVGIPVYTPEDLGR